MHESIDVINLFLRSAIGILSLGIGFEAWRMYVALGGLKLSKTIKKIAVIFAIYGIARILSSAFDYYMEYNHILLSVLVHDVAFIALWLVFRRRRLELESAVETDGASIKKARESLDGAIGTVENILGRRTRHQ